MDFTSPGPAPALTTAHVSPEMLGEQIAVDTLVTLGVDLNLPVGEHMVAVFLSLAERHGWDPLGTAKTRNHSHTFTQEETLLEWLASHRREEPACERRWPTDMDALKALDREGKPPARNQSWLMAMAALSGSPLWDNRSHGIPLVIFNCLVNQHTSILDLAMALPGAPSMEAIFQASTWDEKTGEHLDQPTWGDWLLNHGPEQLSHLANAYSDVRLTPEQIANCPIENLSLVSPWSPTDTAFRERALEALDKRFTGDEKSVLDLNRWIQSRRAFLNTPPSPKEEQALLQQEVVNQTMSFTYENTRPWRRTKSWKADLALGSPSELLWGHRTTHHRMEGDTPVLAAVLLKSILGPPTYDHWERLVGADLEGLAEQTGLAGGLAPAMNLSFGSGLPLKGLISLDLMDSTKLREPIGGSDTAAGFLLGVSDSDDFIRSSIDEAMEVTNGLHLVLDASDGNAAAEITQRLAKKWQRALQKERRDHHRNLLEGRTDLQISLFLMLSHWVGLWLEARKSTKNSDSIQLLLDEMMKSEETNWEDLAIFRDGTEQEQRLQLLKIINARSKEGIETVTRHLQQASFSEGNHNLLTKRIEAELKWFDEYLADGKNKDWGYPLQRNTLLRCKEAALGARLTKTHLVIQPARL